MSSAEIEHSILHSIFADLTNPAENRIQFFNIQYFYLDFCIQFLLTWTRLGVYLVVYLDISWCLPGLEPGRRKTFNFEGTKTFNLWNGGLTSDSEGSKSQKTIQFPADQMFPRCFPGVVLVSPGKKKEAEASRFNLEIGFVSKLRRVN